MDELIAIAKFGREYGVLGILTVLVLFDKVKLIKRYIAGDFVSWKDISERLQMLETRVAQLGVGSVHSKELHQEVKALEMEYASLAKTVIDHLTREALEDIKMAKLESEAVSLKDKVETENNHIFSQLKSLHEKFDTLTRIMMERRGQ